MQLRLAGETVSDSEAEPEVDPDAFKVKRKSTDTRKDSKRKLDAGSSQGLQRLTTKKNIELPEEPTKGAIVTKLRSENKESWDKQEKINIKNDA